MVIIGISGGSGSGKTTFLKELKLALPDEQVSILSQDEYYKPIHEQWKDGNGIENFDLPSSIDLDAFVVDIKKLKNNESISRLEYTFNNKDKEPEVIECHPGKVLIVEGLFIFQHQEISDLLDLKVIIQASDVNKVIRRIKRDRVERNYPLEDVLYRYEHHVLPSFEQYIEPYLDKVDIIINNNVSFSKALSMFIYYLKGVIASK